MLKEKPTKVGVLQVNMQYITGPLLHYRSLMLCKKPIIHVICSSRLKGECLVIVNGISANCIAKEDCYTYLIVSDCY